ncbi:hypothetical protein GSH10_26100 [Burkholderia pseudomallei]|nr:hypothetical protein [Burkholderia pseudomallei]MBM5647364.1 hypothetical protein [Burkholderia pseudomallei]
MADCTADRAARRDVRRRYRAIVTSMRRLRREDGAARWRRKIGRGESGGASKSTRSTRSISPMNSAISAQSGKCEDAR